MLTDCESFLTSTCFNFLKSATCYFMYIYIYTFRTVVKENEVHSAVPFLTYIFWVLV